MPSILDSVKFLHQVALVVALILVTQGQTELPNLRWQVLVIAFHNEEESHPLSLA